MTADTLLDIQNLHVKFNTPEESVYALNGVDFQIKQGESIGIVGESGSGKTQLFRSILGLSGPHAEISGKALFDQDDLVTVHDRVLRKILGDRITMVFQDPLSSFNPYLKMSAQMTEMLMAHRNMTKKEAEKSCIDMMNRVRIPEAEKRFRMYPHEFSGGMRQRMMIAMALLPQPDLIIADEPTTALDVTLQAQILEIFNECRQMFRAAIVFITHDLGVAASICDKVAIMYGGKVLETGPIEEVLRSPKHPYTHGLINSIPKLSGEIETLNPIPGNPGNFKTIPTGCTFVERCPHAFERCHKEQPLLENILPQRHRACFMEDI